MDLASLRISVVGAGIGGLAAAAALGKLGAEVTIYERAPSLGEVGQGLGMFANAVRALDWIGVGAEIRAVGHRITAAATLDGHGRELFALDLDDHERRTGVPSLLLTRPQLHAALEHGVPGHCIMTGHALADLRDEDGGVRLFFENGTSARTDLVIGADGYRSAVRRALWGERPLRYSGLICWRGMTRGVDMSEPDRLAVIQGGPVQFGICPLGASGCYWFVTYPGSPAESPREPEVARALLLERLRAFPGPAADLVAATQAHDLLRTDLHDLPPLATWIAGRVVLLGDAAHPLLPTLGQGAALAIEDAVVLARRLQASPNLPAALTAYQAERKPRAAAMVRTAHRLGRLSLWSNPVGVAVRDAMLRATPPFMLRRMMEAQIGYDAASA